MKENKERKGLLLVRSDRKGACYVNYGTNNHHQIQQSNAVDEYILTCTCICYIVKCKIVCMG